MISDSILHVFILEDWQIDFHMAFTLPVVSARVCMSGSSWSIGPWWNWWGSWHGTSVTLEPMTWWRWRWWRQCCPEVLSHLAMVLALLWHPPLVLVGHLMCMPRLLHTFIGAWEPLLQWEPVLLAKPEQWKCWWMSIGISWPSSISTSIWWWFALSLAGLLTDLMHWQWVGPACQPNWWLLITWMWHHAPCPS